MSFAFAWVLNIKIVSAWENTVSIFPLTLGIIVHVVVAYRRQSYRNF